MRKYTTQRVRHAELKVKLSPKMTNLKEAADGLLFIEGDGEIVYKQSVVKADGTQKMWLYDTRGKPAQCYTENAACRRVIINVNKE